MSTTNKKKALFFLHKVIIQNLTKSLMCWKSLEQWISFCTRSSTGCCSASQGSLLAPKDDKVKAIYAAEHQRWISPTMAIVNFACCCMNVDRIGEWSKCSSSYMRNQLLGKMLNRWIRIVTWLLLSLRQGRQEALWRATWGELIFVSS